MATSGTYNFNLDIDEVIQEATEMIGGEQKEMQPLSKGGRAGYKAGSKGCKLAMKGKGRAYGKNS